MSKKNKLSRMKIIAKAKEPEKQSEKIFNIKGKMYLVTCTTIGVKVTLGDEVVFSTNESGRTFKQWLQSERMK